MIEKLVATVFGTALLVLSLAWGAANAPTHPTTPHHSDAAVEQLLESLQHGPDVECQRLCAPEGSEGELEENPQGLPVVTCAGHHDEAKACTKGGEQCGMEHRVGCAEACRAQCCACCSI